MILNNLSKMIGGKDNVYSLNYQSTFQSLLNTKNLRFSTSITTLENSKFKHELEIIYGNNYVNNIESADLVIMTEPDECEIKEDELNLYIENYENTLKEAQKYEKNIVHLVRNEKWINLFIHLIRKNNINVFSPNSDILEGRLEAGQIYDIHPYLDLSDMVQYSNEINNNMLIDLTEGYKKDYHYKLNISQLVNNALQEFDNIDILINDGSFIPELINSNVHVYTKSNYSIEKMKNNTYVYLYTNSPYDLGSVNKYIYYAANSKVVFSNYNYYINNLLPSIILNLSKEGYNLSLLPKEEAFNIINENRNTILFHHSLLNVLNGICETMVGNRFFYPIKISDTLEYFNPNIFIEHDNNNPDIILDINNFKYDLEAILLFPILFLGEGKVSYMRSQSYKKDGNDLNSIILPDFEDRIVLDEESKLFSMIVPIHNNGRYLKYKCFNSILRLSCLKNIEIIFIDDGSSNNETIRIINDLLTRYPTIIYKKFDSGSGSASRPRNVGVNMAKTEYITFLDPDNEAIEDGYTILINELEKDDNLDMVVGDIVREDNFKRNEISYYKKLTRIQDSPYINDTKQTLINLGLTVQSIQALMVRKSIILENKIKMVEGAAGQDTLYFQELILKCNKVKVINHNVHSYYAYVDGSVTNTVTAKFFEKFYKVEKERIKFLVSQGLIDNYMKYRFNMYVKNWYFKKYDMIIGKEEREKAVEYIQKIILLYQEYQQDFQEEILNFMQYK